MPLSVRPRHTSGAWPSVFAGREDTGSRVISLVSGPASLRAVQPCEITATQIARIPEPNALCVVIRRQGPHSPLWGPMSRHPNGRFDCRLLISLLPFDSSGGSDELHGLLVLAT